MLLPLTTGSIQRTRLLFVPTTLRCYAYRRGRDVTLNSPIIVHMARKTTPLCYVTFYVRCSVFHLGYVSLYVRCSVLDLPTGGSRVLCTCTADIVLHAVQSVFGCACARNFLLWNCFLYELFRIFRLLAWLISFRRC